MNSKRQLKIINIIKNEEIRTQDELVARLHQSGIDVTQATISRDIKRLGLIKVPDGHGQYRYSLPDEKNRGDINNWLKRMFQDFVIDMEYSENLIILKTLPGTAMGLGSALDNAEWEGIIGSVAGDDTVLLVTKPKELTGEIFRRMEELLL